MNGPTNYHERRMAHYFGKLEPLVGAEVVGLARSGEGDCEEFVGLVFRLPDGQKKVLFFLRDDEGNGPGSFSIDPA